MPSEDPILDVPFILAFDQNDPLFPIIAVPKDPRNRTIPTFGGALVNPEWHTDFPDNKFDKVQVVPGVTKRVHWIYRIIPGPTVATKEIDQDGAVISVAKTLRLNADIHPGETFADPTWQEITQENSDSDYYAMEVVKTRPLPGPIVTEFIIHSEFSSRSSGIPILISNRKEYAGLLWTEGEFRPAALTVSAISLGASPTVTLTAKHELPPGAWVAFAGTNSTPSLGTAPLQIVSCPTETTVVVTPAAAVTIVGTSGTMQATHLIARELKPTEHALIKMKVESMIGCADPSAFNTDVAGEISYPFPEFARSFKFYEDASLTVIGTAASGTPRAGNSWSGGVGIDLQPGYRGPCNGRIQKFYFSGPPPDSFASNYSPTVIIPSAGTFVIQGGSCETVGFPTVYDQISVSNSFRTGTIPAVITGAAPALSTVPSTAGALGVTAITTGDASGTPNYPLVTTALAHGLSAGMTVKFSGMNCTPAITGPYQIVDTGTGGANTFHINATVTVSGNTGSVRLFSTAAFGSGTASCVMNLSESFPPKLVGLLTIDTIGTGASPVITLSGTHYWQVGQRVKLLGTTCTPPIPDGIYRIASVPAAAQITIVAPTTVTGAQSSPAGTARGMIMLMEEPHKIGPGLWVADVRLVEIPYSSGEAPA